MNYLEQKQAICDVGHKLWQLNFVAANDGNITLKIDDNVLLATPTGVSKSELTTDMILEVDFDGNVITPSKFLPSSEIKMHLRCYKTRTDIMSVVHAHPPYATGFAIANIPLDFYTMPEAILSLGSVPIAPYGTPSTNEIPDSLMEFLQSHDVILLQNHGAISVGSSLKNAYYKMETLEHYAKTTSIAMSLGGVKELNQKQIKDCLNLRSKYNMTGKHPGYKKFKK